MNNQVTIDIAIYDAIKENNRLYNEWTEDQTKWIDLDTARPINNRRILITSEDAKAIVDKELLERIDVLEKQLEMVKQTPIRERWYHRFIK